MATLRERLADSRWTPTLIDATEKEQKDLVPAIPAELALHTAIDGCENEISFNVGQSVLNGRFESLPRLIGEIATVFPGTAEVESDFSIVKAEMDDI